MTYKPKSQEDNKFEEFINEITNVVMNQYSECRASGLVEPIAFLGVEPDFMDVDKYIEKFEPVKRQYEQCCKQMGDEAPTKLEFLKKHLTILGLPLGPFFEDGGDFKSEDRQRAFMQFKKESGANMIKAAIKKLEKDGLGNLKYFVFISEAYMAATKPVSDEMKTAMSTGQISDTELHDKVMEDFHKAGGVRNMPNAEEKVIFIFETRYQTRMITYDLLLNEETNFCELINKNDMGGDGRANSMGIFTGFLHKENSNYSSN